MNRDEPVRLEVVLPLISDQFLNKLSSGIGFLMDPVESLVQGCSGVS